MKKTKLIPTVSTILGCLLGIVLLSGSGCGRITTETNSPDEVKKNVPVAEQRPMDNAIELLRGQSDLQRCQEAIKTVNSHLLRSAEDRAKIGKLATDAKLLSETFALTEDEIDYVNKNNFTTLDGFHLEWCFRLRDVAEAMRLRDLPPLKQAERGFAWAARQVVLDNSSDEVLPPAFVQMRGSGTAQERALVFLALMHQLDLPGCMIAVPKGSGSEKHYWLAGVLIKDKANKQAGQIYLFEPRLGIPVPGPNGQGNATLEQLRQNPDLVKQLSAGEGGYDVTPEQAAKAEIYLVSPLSALTARMQFLEDELNTVLHVRLAESPEKLLKQFKPAGEVHVWNRASSENSPVRALRLLLPPESGGVGSQERFRNLQSEFVPWAPVLRRYQDMGFFSDDFTALARPQLLRFTEEMFARYLLEPRDKLIRGRWEDDLTKPIVQFQDVLRGFHRSRFYQDAEHRSEELKTWMERVNEAYLALHEGQPGAEQYVGAVWGEDQFFTELIMPRDRREDNELRIDLPRKSLTYIMLSAVDEPLGKAGDYLLALAWLEKAERAQARIDHLAAQGKRVAPLWQKEARASWINAIGSANIVGYGKKYLNRYPISDAAIEDRLEDVEESPPNLAIRLGMLDELLQDVHRHAGLRLHLADGLIHAGQKPEAAALLKDLKKDLQALLNNNKLRKMLKELADNPRELPPQQGAQARRLVETLQDNGSLRWYLHAAEYRLAK